LASLQRIAEFDPDARLDPEAEVLRIEEAVVAVEEGPRLALRGDLDGAARASSKPRSSTPNFRGSPRPRPGA
jgi:hypothetical protein